MPIHKSRKKLPPRTKPKRVTAIFTGKRRDALAMLQQAEVGGAVVRELSGRVAIQHPALDKLGEGAIEDVCIAQQLPLEVVLTMRDFTDLGARPTG